MTMHHPAEPLPPDCACGEIACDRAIDDAPSSDVSMTDWGDLLTAVKERLGAVVVGADVQHAGVAQHVQSAVRECVSALDQLQLTLAHELGRRQHDVFDARTALAAARAELLGTRASETQARHLAAHDPLTLLPNRRFLHDRLSDLLGQRGGGPKTLAVLFLDLDGFKQVNDEHGHPVGDQLLQIVAARLNRLVRADDMVGRLGGDEFCLLLPGVSERMRLRRLAGKLLQAVAAPVRLGTLTLKVSASVGIAVWPTDGSSADELLSRADKAMYVAKRTRHSHAFFGDAASPA